MILVLMFIYFTAMIFWSFFASRWIMELVYKSAGVTKRDVEHYRRDHYSRYGEKQKYRAVYWLESRSADKKRTRKLVFYHQLALGVSAVLVFAGLSCPTMPFLPEKARTAVLVGAAALLPVYNIALTVAGKAVGKKLSDDIPETRPAGHEDYNPREDDYDPFDELGDYNPEEPPEADLSGTEEIPPEIKRKRRIGRVISLVLFLICATGFVCAVVFRTQPGKRPQEPVIPEGSEPSLIEASQTGETKSVLTAEQFTDVLEAHDFSPQSVTEQDINREYEKLITVQTDTNDFFMEFYVWPDEDSAKNLYESAKSQLMWATEHPPVQAEEAGENYSRYETAADGWFYMTAYVGNTALSASCTDERKDELKKILEEML